MFIALHTVIKTFWMPSSWLWTIRGTKEQYFIFTQYEYHLNEMTDANCKKERLIYNKNVSFIGDVIYLWEKVTANKRFEISLYV